MSELLITALELILMFLERAGLVVEITLCVLYGNLIEPLGL